MSRKRWLGVGVALVAVVAAAAVVIVTLSGSEGSDSYVITSRSTDELRESLVDDGWSCYDMGDQPVATECYLWHNDDTATLTMNYAVPDGLATLSLETPIVGNGLPDDLFTDTANLIDNALLPPENETALHETNSPHQRIVDGVYAERSAYGFVLSSEGRVSDLEQFEPKSLPTMQQTLPLLHQQHFECETEWDHDAANNIRCRRSHQNVDIHVEGVVVDGGATNLWSLSAVPTGSEPEAITDSTRVLAATAREVGLTDDEGASFIQENPQPGQQGVFQGYHLEVSGTGVGPGDSEHHTPITVSINTFTPR
ncbi:MAG TPA: hypothetical protein VK053_20280 [Jiangellaceae bacterium]|nr:hypothetical protein [Jiangellaceae bacterium]